VITMAGKPWRDVKAKLNTPPERKAKAKAATDAYVRGYRLAEMRRHQNLTQVEVAQLMGVDQSRVSRIERGENIELATLRAYIEALGGHVKVVADFGDEQLTVA
jgi:predicted XRE-type DNA-binding protein